MQRGLTLASPFFGPQIDFSSLAGAGQAIGQAFRGNKLRSDMQGVVGPDGTINYDKAIAVLMQHDPIVGMKLATDREAAASLAGYREAQLTQPPQPTEAMRNAEFFGAMDPNDPRVRFAPRGSSRQLARPVINDLVAKGEGAFKTGQLAESFKDEYGGWKMGAVGDAANAIARNTGIGNEAAATWWQDYGRYRNVVRNQLFGSALTGYEGSQWEKADITPGMMPETIRANLKIQQQAADRAARKLARVYVKQGYDQEAIEEALGVSLDDLEPTVGDPGQNANNVTNAPAVLPDGSMTPTQAGVAGVGEDIYPEAGPRPSQNDMQMLRQYANDPGFREEFERLYGRGSVDRWLGVGEWKPR